MILYGARACEPERVRGLVLIWFTLSDFSATGSLFPSVSLLLSYSFEYEKCEIAYIILLIFYIFF